MSYLPLFTFYILVVICGFPPNTSNGAWYANNGYTEGSFASLNCTNGYYPVDVNLECLSSGNWSSVNISCIPCKSSQFIFFLEIIFFRSFKFQTICLFINVYFCLNFYFVRYSLTHAGN